MHNASRIHTLKKLNMFFVGEQRVAALHFVTPKLGANAVADSRNCSIYNDTIISTAVARHSWIWDSWGPGGRFRPDDPIYQSGNGSHCKPRTKPSARVPRRPLARYAPLASPGTAELRPGRYF